MKPTLTLISALLLAAGAAPASPAYANDIHKASKVICSPDRLTRCDQQNKCETVDAGERDRNRPIIFDFAAKKAFGRRTDEEKKETVDREIGTIAEDAIKGDTRTIVVRGTKGDDDARPIMTGTLSSSGKLTGENRGGRQRFEASCKPM